MTESWLFVTDLDRTLINPERAVEVVDGVAAGMDLIQGGSLLQKAHSNKGANFDVFGYLAGQGIEADQLEAIETTALQSTPSGKLFFGDTQEYLDAFNRGDDAFKLCIFTYGQEAWQRFKLRLSALDKYPFIITQSIEKSLEIGSWPVNPSGLVYPPQHPELASTNIIVVDDKLIGLRGVSKGYLIDRTGQHASESHENIEVVTSLRDVLLHENLK